MERRGGRTLKEEFSRGRRREMLCCQYWCKVNTQRKGRGHIFRGGWEWVNRDVVAGKPTWTHWIHDTHHNGAIKLKLGPVFKHHSCTCPTWTLFFPANSTKRETIYICSPALAQMYGRLPAVLNRKLKQSGQHTTKNQPVFTFNLLFFKSTLVCFPV